LIVEAGNTQIKIEVTPLSRGCVYQPVVRSVSARVEEEFGFAEIQVVSFADLYAGVVAALVANIRPISTISVTWSPTRESTRSFARLSLLTSSVVTDRWRRCYIQRASILKRNSDADLKA
jgi:hypothetical protein